MNKENKIITTYVISFELLCMRYSKTYSPFYTSFSNMIFTKSESEGWLNV